MEAIIIGDCQFYPARFEIEREGKVVSLSDKSTLLLSILFDQAGQDVPRNTLLDEIWTDCVVSDDSLTNLVSVTRQKLKLLGREELIKTVPKRGYSMRLPSAVEPPDKLVHKPFYLYVFLTLVIIAIVIAVSINNHVSKSVKTEQLSIGILPNVMTFNTSKPLHPEIKATMLTNALMESTASHSAAAVFSNARVNHIWNSTHDFTALYNELGLSYAIESQTLEQKNHYLVRLQLVNTKTSQVLQHRTFNISMSLMSDNKSKIWERVAQLFVYSVFYDLGFYQQDKERDAHNICNLYVDQLLLYTDGFLEDTDEISKNGSRVCKQSSALSPRDIDIQRTSNLFFINLALNENQNIEKKQAHIREVDSIVGVMRSIDSQAIEYAEAYAGLIYLYVIDNTREKDVGELFKNIDILTQQQLAKANMSVEFARNVAIIKNYEAVYLHRDGKDAETTILYALDMVDRGLVLDVEDITLLHTKARLYKTWASIETANGRDPSTMLQYAISTYNAIISLTPKLPQVYDNVANAYSSMAKWKASHGQAYKTEFNAALLAYKQTIALAPSFHYTYNNMADLYASLLDIGDYNQPEYRRFLSEGLTAANTALSLKNEYVWAILNSGYLHLSRTKESYAFKANTLVPALECVQYYKQGLILRPRTVEAVAQQSECELYLAKHYLHNVQFDEAVQHLLVAKTLLDKALTQHNSYYSLAWVAGEERLISAIALLAKKHANEAKAAIMKGIEYAHVAMKAKKDDPNAYFVLFRLLWLQHSISPTAEHLAEIESVYQNMLALFPHEPRNKVLTQVIYAKDDYQKVDDNYRHLILNTVLINDIKLTALALPIPSLK